MRTGFDAVVVLDTFGEPIPLSQGFDNDMDVAQVERPTILVIAWEVHPTSFDDGTERHEREYVRYDLDPDWTMLDINIAVERLIAEGWVVAEQDVYMMAYGQVVVSDVHRKGQG
jgi:hypothetical protein